MPVMHSTGWKTVTLKIHGTNETLQVPVMIAARVEDLRRTLAESLEMDNAHVIEFHAKLGCSWRRMRNGDEVQTSLVVKGIKSFGKKRQHYHHPYGIIGGGHYGLRQAMHYQRNGLPYGLFERKPALGGNAWYDIANFQSKLQSEGPQYQLNYDVNEGVSGLLFNYGNFPSRSQILKHFDDVCAHYGIWPNIVLNTEVVDCHIKQDPNEFEGRAYDLVLKATNGANLEREPFRCSCICYYPGCLCVPHRKVWPGEEIFGGQISYGFGNEFDYRKVYGQEVIVIGMGAFAAENVRTCMEYGCKKAWIVARHFNLLLPRCISWYINQSLNPPPAAFILDAFKPMYDLLGWDPWGFFSITANADRTVATIKQYTRWGIGDSTFLGIYYGKAGIINGEVKRFKRRAAVLVSGQVLENIDHVCKVLGFDGDFGVDRIMHAKEYFGFWPEYDWRRWVMSDQSAIDASRFGGTALAPFAQSFVYTSLFYHQSPKWSRELLRDGSMPIGVADFALGSPGYHYEPRAGTAVYFRYTSYPPECQDFERRNAEFKKASMWYLAPPGKFVEECQADWYHYCEMFKAQGDDRPFPKYPYDEQYLRELQDKEIAQAKKEAEIIAKRQAREMENQQAAAIHDLSPRSKIAFDPMRAVLKARCRSISPKPPTLEERNAYLTEGQESLKWVKANTRNVVPALTAWGAHGSGH